MYNNSIITQVLESPLPDARKQVLSSIFRGEKLANICRDVVAKHVFSPDLHPERMDYILQHVMKQPEINVSGSASNEAYLQNIYSKKTITDIPAWLKDHRMADLAFQISSQEFIFTRADIYASNMLLLQYSAEAGQPKSEITYENINGVIIIVLMKNSPKVFRDYNSMRYIHRFTQAHADSGLTLPMLKQMVFIQLDKALEMYISQDYNEDEDIELLELLALIADINNEKIVKKSENNKFLSCIREDVFRFTQSKEVQQMILAEDLAIMDWNSSLSYAKREAAAEGRAEGITAGRMEGQAESKDEIRNLNKWLFSEGRADDIRRYTDDPSYLDELLAEYRSLQLMK